MAVALPIPASDWTPLMTCAAASGSKRSVNEEKARQLLFNALCFVTLFCLLAAKAKIHLLPFLICRLSSSQEKHPVGGEQQ
jgi:hypothetical protein